MARGFDAAFALSAVHYRLNLPDLVSPCAPRQALVDQLLAQAQANGVVAVVAEPGSGKTQMLRLAADRVGRPTHWLNLPRHATEELACILLDALIRMVGRPPDNLPLREEYAAAAEEFRGTLVVIEDLPRLFPGGQLAMRVETLADRLRGVEAQLLLSSYYALPATTEQLLGKVYFDIRGSTITDLADLFAAAARATRVLGRQNLPAHLIGNPGLAHVGYGSGSLPREPQLEIHEFRKMKDCSAASSPWLTARMPAGCCRSPLQIRMSGNY